MVLARVRACPTRGRRLAFVAQAPERTVTGFRPPPERHWRSYGTEPLPTPQGALGLPFRASSSWFLRITCDRSGKATMLNEAHTGERRGTLLPRVLISRIRHEGCAGRAG